MGLVPGENKLELETLRFDLVSGIGVRRMEAQGGTGRHIVNQGCALVLEL